MLYPPQVEHMGFAKGSWRLSVNVCCVLCRCGALVSMVCMYKSLNICQPDCVVFTTIYYKIRLIDGPGTKVLFAATSDPLPNHSTRAYLWVHIMSLYLPFTERGEGHVCGRPSFAVFSSGDCWQYVIPTLVYCARVFLPLPDRIDRK